MIRDKNTISYRGEHFSQNDHTVFERLLSWSDMEHPVFLGPWLWGDWLVEVLRSGPFLVVGWVIRWEMDLSSVLGMGKGSLTAVKQKYCPDC